MVVTGDATLAAAVRDLREYDKREDDHVRFNFKLSDLHAAVARQQLAALSRNVATRRRIAAEYHEAFSGLQARLILPLSQHDSPSIYYRFVVQVASGLDRAIQALRRKGISCHRAVFKLQHPASDSPRFPGAVLAHSRNLSIPLYPGLTPGEKAAVAAAVRAVFR